LIGGPRSVRIPSEDYDMIEAVYAFLLKIFTQNPVLYATVVVIVMLVEGLVLATLFEATLRFLAIIWRKTGR